MSKDGVPLTKSESAALGRRVARLEKELYRGSILNWECWQGRDVKQLAGNVRAVSELAHLATKGLRATLDNGGTCSDAEWTILDDLMGMATVGSFVLARARRGGRHRRAEGRCVMETPRRSDRPGLLLWFNTGATLRARLLMSERGMAGEQMTVRPEDTLRAAGISGQRQARYQRWMSSLLAGR